MRNVSAELKSKFQKLPRNRQNLSGLSSVLNKLVFEHTCEIKNLVTTSRKLNKLNKEQKLEGLDMCLDKANDLHITALALFAEVMQFTEIMAMHTDTVYAILQSQGVKDTKSIMEIVLSAPIKIK